MQTKKDAEIVAWIGRIGAAGAEHVMGRFAMSRTRAYACLSRLVTSGLLDETYLIGNVLLGRWAAPSEIAAAIGSPV